MDKSRPGVKTAVERVFAILTVLSLLGSLAAMLSWSQGWVMPMWLLLLRCAAAVLGLVLWKRRDAGFLILMGYLALVILRLLIPSPEKLFIQSVSQTLFNGAWAFLGCYSLGHILGYRRAERFLKFFLACWAFCMACHSAVALYAVWTDQRIWNIGEGGFWGLNIASGKGESRLRMLFDPNTSGILFCSAAVAAFLGAAGSRNRRMKALYILAFVPNWTALSLTDSRTAQVSAAAGIGTAAGILILQAVKKRRKKNSLAWTAAACGALLTAAVCIGLSLGTVFAFNALKTAKGGLLPAAGAEAEPAEIRVRVKTDVEKAGIGDKVTLKAVVKGAEGEISYRWQYGIDGKWADLKGKSAKRQKCRITVKDNNTYKKKYRCIVTAENGKAVSNKAKILKPYEVSLAFRSLTSADGDTITIIAETDEAEGEILYQWQVRDNDSSWTDMPGSTRDAITVEIQERKQYRCVVTAGNGTVISEIKTVSKPSGTMVKTRTLDGGDLLSGRADIWKQTIRFLVSHPRTFLTGRSVNEPMKSTGIMRSSIIVTEHCHNMILQTLMESGLPGLFLLLAFIFCTGRRAVRLAADEKKPLLVRQMPAAVCALWVGELTECIVRMTNIRVPMLGLLMLYAGIVCATGKKEQNS